MGALIVAALTAGVSSLPVAAAMASYQDGAGVSKKASGARSHASSTTKKSAGATAAKAGTTSTKKSAHSKSSRSRSKKVRGQAAPTADRINEIQEALASKGAFTGTPTGKWDDDTVASMKRFQAAHGLEPTGKLDALTLQKLGLGSQTAGLAAPVAPPNSVNRLRNTTSSPDEPRTDP